MWAIRRVTTARWCRPARPPWFTARDGITRPTSVPQCGTAGPTPTVWEQDSPTARHRVGALVSGMGTATIRITTRGGDRWATTDAAGIRITAGAEQRSPTCTESGATRRIRARARPGPIHTLETTEPPAAVPTTTHRPAGRQLPAAALTPTSIPATQPGIVAERPIIRTQASSREEELDTLGTSTPARARPDVVALPTTRTRMPGLLPARTTSTQAKTARCTVITGTAAAGRPTAAADGSQPPSRMQICSASNRCARKEQSVPRTSTPRAVTAVAPVWAAEAADGGSCKPQVEFAPRKRVLQGGSSCLPGIVIPQCTRSTPGCGLPN